MSDDVDLYDDLPVLGFGESVCKIDEERQYFKKQLGEKEKDLHNIREQVSHLEKENKTLAENLSSLYKTAVNEIQRKDKVIEELRREKESLIFRRRGRQNHCISSSTNIHTDGLDNKVHPTYLSNSGEKSTVKSAKSTIFPCNSNVYKRQKDKTYPCESTSDVAVISRKLDGSLSKLSESYVPVQEKNSDSSSKVCKAKYVTQTISVTCENSCSKTSDTLSEKSSCSSHLDSHQNDSRGQSREATESKHEREKRSLSSENRRENRHIQKSYYSEKHCSARSRHRSPLNRYKSSRLHDEDTRQERSWNRNDCRKYHRDVYKESRGQKLSVGLDVELRRQYYLHSKRSPSPQWSRRSAHSPVQRYPDPKYKSPNVNRNIKPQSENIRLATQLKSKYSKAMRERSLSCTPVKHKLRCDLRPLQLQDVSHDAFQKLSAEENVVSIHPVNKDNLNGGEHLAQTVPKSCTSNTTKEKYSEILSKESDNSLAVAQCSSVKKKKCNSADVYNFGQIDENGSSMKKETSKESNVVLEYNSGGHTEHCSSKMSYSESFLIENEDKSKKKEGSFNGELQSQQMKTPPSRNLIPLKISPTFENPAVVKENKFSLCVFNEQCEFRRPKRKRSVKLLVTEYVSDTGDKKLETKRSNETSGVHYYEEGDAVTQNTVASKHVNSSLVQNTSDEMMCCVNLQNINLRKRAAWKKNNSLSEVHVTDTIIAENEEGNQQKTILVNKDAYSCMDLKTVNTTEKLSAVDVLKNKSPNKKRKLDSICDELKANLEKKTITNPIKNTPFDNSIALSNHNDLNGSSYTTNCKNSISTVVDAEKIPKCDMTSSEVVKSNQPLKHIVVSKRRRKQPNLQDNEVQVLSQVKSRLL